MANELLQYLLEGLAKCFYFQVFDWPPSHECTFSVRKKLVDLTIDDVHAVNFLSKTEVVYTSLGAA